MGLGVRTSIIGSKGIVELETRRLGQLAQRRLNAKLTPDASMVITCSYFPSRGQPKKPNAKLTAEASIRSLMSHGQ